MALTRAQLLMGNDTQGAVLPGEVQAVKQGAGVLIGTDGTISVDASSVVGLVKLNNAAAFNGYVWPNTKGAQGQMLTMGAGNALTWTNGGVFVSSSAPLNPEIGDLWFDCTVGQLLVYEACTTGAPQWTGGTAGLPVLPGDTSASPAFASGSGTFLDPYICTASAASVSGAIVVNRVTVTDLAPFQFVQIVDLAGVVNGGRFSFSNNVANSSGILVFDILFTDSPTSTVGTTYTCQVKIGSGTVYVNAPVTMTDVFVLNSPGSISGSGQIGTPFTYTTGTAAGGSLPIVYTWTWKLFSTNAVLQQNGATYIPLQSQFGDSVYVTLTATDNDGQVVSGNTTESAPISRPPFPNPTPPVIPSTVGITSTFNWDGDPTTLSSDGCLLFNVAGGTFSQGPTSVTSGQTVGTKWSNGSPNVCGNANTGTFIEGCLFDTSFSACSSLTIDRIPNAISFDPETVAPGGIATSLPVTITGNNAPAYVTLAAGSGGSNYLVSIGGGSFQTIPNAGVYTLGILSGQTLVLRFTAGSAGTTGYSYNIQLGDSTGSTSASFVATTTADNFPTTSITFPTTTSGTGSVGTSVAWGNGTTTITATGCIEFSVDGGSSYTQLSTAITDGVQLKTRFKAGATCADNTTGQTITGSITNNTYTESTSLTINRTPAAVSFSGVTGAIVSTQYTSNSVTPSGYNSTAYVTLAAGATITGMQAAVGTGAFTSIPASGSTSLPIEPGQTLQIRGTSGGAFSTTYNATIELGVTGSVTTSAWSIANGAAVPAVTTPTIQTPSNNSTNVGTNAGITLTSSTYAAANGAGSHASSSWQVYSAASVSPTTTAITAVSSTPSYQFAYNKSVSFNPSLGNQSLSRTQTGVGNRRKYTLAFWYRKANANSAQTILSIGNSAAFAFTVAIDNGSGKIRITETSNSSEILDLLTTATFNDTTKWHSIIIAVDTTQADSFNRVFLYVDGVSIAGFDTSIVYAQNDNSVVAGAVDHYWGGGGFPFTTSYTGYLTGVNYINNEALAATSLGAVSGSDWIPIEYTGSFGTGGYEFLFDTGYTNNVINSTNIGTDTSGNGNTFTPSFLYSGDSRDYSFQWQANVPSVTQYVLVGNAGAQGAPPPSGGENGKGMGGGGGVIVNNSFNPTLSTLYPLTTNTTTFSFQGGTVDKGGDAPAGTFPGENAIGGNGGASGAPTSFPGGSGAAGVQGAGPPYAGGGGGSAGAGGSARPAPGGFNGGAGAGIANSLTGTSREYGRGGSGLPVYGAGGLAIGWTAGTGDFAASGSWMNSANTSSPQSQTFYTRLGQLQTDIPHYQSWTVESPTPGGTANTGIGRQVAGTYCIWNINEKGTNLTISNSGLDYSSGGAGLVKATGGFSSGKYYWEITPYTNKTLTGLVGIAKSSASNSTNPGATADSYAYDLSNGNRVSNTSNSYGNAATSNAVIGFALDLDSGEMYFSINGTWQNSGNPLTNTNPAFINLTSGPYFPAVGGTVANAQTVNFGQRPFIYAAPTGYAPAVTTEVTTTLTFTDNTGLSSMFVGNTLLEDSGDASGIISGINAGTSQITVGSSLGIWSIGSTATDTSVVGPAPAPTTEPPNPLLYTLRASATNSVVDLTSFSVSKPPLAATTTYYARVQYTSNTTVVTSSYSPWSKFTTGNLS